MTTVIFLGPSLPRREARALLDAAYLPPAQQSDILSAIQRYRPRVIGLIDGAFGQALSVWHKEILYALDRGIHVYGASSMGALRAAETSCFGTVGIGQVYRMYADGQLTDDDEVALAHADADADYRPLSEPMVNVRVTLGRARDAGIVTAAVHDQLIGLAKAIFFAERSYRGLWRLARATGIAPDTVDALETYVARGNAVDIKRQDAIELLTTVAALPDTLPPFEPRVAFRRSPQFETLYQRDRRAPHDGEDVPLASIASYAALHLTDFTERNARALDRALVGVLGQLLGVEATEEQVDAELKRFRRVRRLATDEELAHWLERNDLELGELRALMRELAVARRLHAWLATRKGGERTTKFVLDELRLSGDYELVARRAATQERILKTAPPPADDDQPRSTADLVLEHLRATGCRIGTSYEAWAEEVGFHRTEDLRFELERSRRARIVTTEAARQLADALTTA
jgi:hypothetical protein